MNINISEKIRGFKDVCFTTPEIKTLSLLLFYTGCAALCGGAGEQKDHHGK